MCYHYSLRKKMVKEQGESHAHEVAFWARINAWVREARAALATQSRHRRHGKVIG